MEVQKKKLFLREITKLKNRKDAAPIGPVKLKRKGHKVLFPEHYRLQSYKFSGDPRISLELLFDFLQTFLFTFMLYSRANLLEK